MMNSHHHRYDPMMDYSAKSLFSAFDSESVSGCLFLGKQKRQLMTFCQLPFWLLLFGYPNPRIRLSVCACVTKRPQG